MTQRYFLELAYFGKNFVGWQSQPNGTAVQEVIEQCLSTILQEEISVVGCGRTDAGVHASQYFLHFDGPIELPKHFLDRINKMIGLDIAFITASKVPMEAHARFDATKRSYTYHIHGQKNPFQKDISTFFPQMDQLDFESMRSIAQQLCDFEEFFPFCKTNSDVLTYKCKLTRAEWIQIKPHQWEFHITSNRFLRGMVRLIVGMSIKVGLGKASQSEVIIAMENQTPLAQSFSAPGEGLFLSEISYPFL